MASEGSVTRWLGEIKAGDEIAAENLWQRYFAQLVRLCRKKLAGHPRRAADEEDVALSAFDSFCRGMQEGRFPQLRDRDNLWRLLIIVAARKAIDYLKFERREKRGGGKIYSESELAADGHWESLGSLEQVVGTEPTPEFAALVAEERERLLSCLDDEMSRRVAQQKFEGYTNEEIAQQLNCSPRTVQRKLWLIRSKYAVQGVDGG